MKELENALIESIEIRKEILSDSGFYKAFNLMLETVVKTFGNKGKILLCGNGGSAADAQHIAAELSGRFKKDREPLFAEALHVNSSYLTAVANDYGYEEVFSRLTKAMGRKGDVLIGLSTSGNSKNVLRAFQKAKEQGMTTIAFTGQKKGEITTLADISFQVPSLDTARIQEVHITIGHALCEAIENRLFK
ncbi:MAG: D-sedoheptulose 7-phosphate isomerase [Salibacteraceae bacterium]